MASQQIRLSEDELLAEYVPLEEFQGWAKQHVTVDPDLLAVLIRDGQVAAVGPGGNFGIGGYWRGVKDALIGKHALRLLVADLKPFQMIAGLNAVSRDNVPIGGELTIEFQINPESGAGVLGLMRMHSAVFKDEVMARIGPHIGDRVIENIVGKMDAAELRGSTMVQDKVQAEVMREAERIFGDMSLLVRNVSMRWELNEEEIAAIERREIERTQERADAQLNALTREIERESVVTELRLNAEMDEEKIKAASEDELRNFVLTQELDFIDARESGKRVQEMKVLHHEINKIKLERTAKLEDAIANSTNELERAKLQDQIRNIQRQTERLDTEQKTALRRLEEMQEIEIANVAKKNSIGNLRDLSAAENDDEDRKSDRKIREEEAAAKARLAELEAKSRMSPEMLLAIQAGNSPEAAAALIEVAKAKAADPNNSSEMMSLVREAMASKDEQTKHAMDSIVAATVGVAHGAGGGRGSAATADVQCSNPDCGRMVPATAKSCHHCGHVLRT